MLNGSAVPAACLPPPRYRSILLAFHLATACLLLCCCSSPSSPEQIAAAFVEKVESAFEGRTIRQIRSLVSSDYLDARRRNHEDIVSLAAGYLIRSRSIHLFADLDSASFAEARVRARVLVAFAARPVAARNLLAGLEADIYWVDIDLAEEDGEWRVVSAEWRQALLEDLFSGDNRE